MPTEKYIESILIRQDNMPETVSPILEDTDVDKLFEFEGIVQLRQILKSITNATHNRQDYVFKIVSIDKLKEDD